MYLIDSNVFLGILPDQQKADECQLFLEKTEKAEEEFCASSFTIHSIEIILERNPLLKNLYEFSNLIKNCGLDSDDVLQLHICKKHKLKTDSYDKNFDKTSIRGLKPSNLI